MTLSTDVLIRTIDPPMTVHSFANDLLGASSEVRKLVDVKPPGSYGRELMSIWNPPGVGLNAWLITTYQPDGPIATKLDARKYCNSDEEYERALAEHEVDPRSQGWGTVNLDFDTTYGAGRDEGWRCGDLHAYLITQIVEKYGADNVKWKNEFTDEWFDGVDGLNEFGDPVKGSIPLRQRKDSSVYTLEGPDERGQILDVLL